MSGAVFISVKSQFYINMEFHLQSFCLSFCGSWTIEMAVKSTFYYCRGPGLSSQHPHSSSHYLLWLQFYRDITASSDLQSHQACMYKYIDAGKHSHKLK